MAMHVASKPKTGSRSWRVMYIIRIGCEFIECILYQLKTVYRSAQDPSISGSNTTSSVNCCHRLKIFNMLLQALKDLSFLRK